MKVGHQPTLPAAAGWLEETWYGSSSRARLARALLAPASAVFGSAVRARNFAYDRGLQRIGTAPVPVVSVGSLRVGGAGKTPFVAWLARELAARGLRPCIVSGGYGGSLRGRGTRMLDAESAAAADAAARHGDEAVLLALRSGCAVAVGRDRAAACAAAFGRRGGGAGDPVDERRPDLFLLDDGFQHRRLARDLDVVLVSGREGRERLLPAGPLREPAAALARADLVVAVGEAGPAGSGDDRAGSVLATAQLGIRLEPVALVRRVADAAGEAAATLRGRRVVAVAAIARPGRFLAVLEALGARVVGSVLRRDHHAFDAGDLREVSALAAGADLVVTSEKDLVKLAWNDPAVELRALRMEVRADERAGAFVDRVAAVVPFDRRRPSTHKLPA